MVNQLIYYKHYLQIKFFDHLSAPEGCLQYHTGVDGRFESFNFPGNSPSEMHLPNQDYQICIRQEEGISNHWYLVIFERTIFYHLVF